MEAYSNTNTAMFILHNCPPAMVDQDVQNEMYKNKDREGLIKSCMALATSLARKHSRRINGIVGLDDLLQISYESLIMAVDGWKPKTGTLATYATTIINRALANKTQEHLDRIYIPAKVALMARRIKRENHRRMSIDMTPMSTIEMKAHLQQFQQKPVTDGEIRAAIHANTIEFSDVGRVTIGAGDDVDEVDFFDSLEDPIASVCERLGMLEASQFCLGLMTSKQREAIVRHNVLGEGWHEIAKEKGVSPQSVQHLQQTAVKKIRETYEIDWG